MGVGSYKVLRGATAVAMAYVVVGCTVHEVQESGVIISQIEAGCGDAVTDAECQQRLDQGSDVVGELIQVGGLAAELVDVVAGAEDDPGKGYSDSGWGITDRDLNRYLTIRSPKTGREWLDRNLGAMQVCQSTTDTLCFGDYFQWGRKADGHERELSYTTTRSAHDYSSVPNRRFILDTHHTDDWKIRSGSDTRMAWYGSDGEHNPCPEGFKIPSVLELQEEMGRRNGSFLNLPQAGYRDGTDGVIRDKKEHGSVWVDYSGAYMEFDLNTSRIVTDSSLAAGRQVRCIAE